MLALSAMMPQVAKIVRALSKLYPKPKKFLQSRSAYEHLVATILSAQCTDERVNRTTPSLFKVANTPKKMVRLGEQRLQTYIKSCGFYRIKAKNIVSMSRDLVEKFGGKVPRDLDKLTTLAGVGRKTASIILTQVYGVPAFPVDTHVFRVANRLGLAHAKTPEKTEMQVRRVVPARLWHDLHLQLISHGRAVCKAPRPLCFRCDARELCAAYKTTFKKAYGRGGRWAKFV